MLAQNDLRGWSFRNQDLTRADLSLAWPTQIPGAVIEGTNLSTVTRSGFAPHQLYSTASYQGNNLNSIQLAQNDVRDWSFRSQSLLNSDFSGSILDRADFTEVADPRGRLRQTTASGFTADTLYATASHRDKNLTGFKFDDNHIEDWNFRDQNLTGASFQRSTFAMTDFRGAIMAGVQLAEATFSDCNLRGAVLTAAYLRKANLERCDLRQADLRAARFSQTVLADTDFRQSDLSGVSFAGAVLTGSDLSGAGNWSARHSATRDYPTSHLPMRHCMRRISEVRQVKDSRRSNCTQLRATRRGS